MNRSSLNTQPEALYLADNADKTGAHRVAAELRRLHDANQELLKPLLAWEKAYCDKDFSLTMPEFDLMVRAAIAKATGEQALAAAPQPAQQEHMDHTSVRSFGPSM